MAKMTQKISKLTLKNFDDNIFKSISLADKTPGYDPNYVQFLRLEKRNILKLLIGLEVSWMKLFRDNSCLINEKRVSKNVTLFWLGV
jgi:hypothetical protein